MMSSVLLAMNARSAIQNSNMIYYGCPGFSLVIVWDIGCGGKIAGLPCHCEVSFPSIYPIGKTQLHLVDNSSH